MRDMRKGIARDRTTDCTMH